LLRFSTFSRRALLFAALFACAIPLFAQAAPSRLFLGRAWYPEQWPESRWDADLALMEQPHMNLVRIGELQTAVTDAGIHAAFGPVPAGVEVCRRIRATHIVYILINHGRSSAHVALPARMHEVLTNKDLGSIDLPTQGIAVLTAEGRL
jgi:beta-galactosidase GanA